MASQIQSLMCSYILVVLVRFLWISYVSYLIWPDHPLSSWHNFVKIHPWEDSDSSSSKDWHCSSRVEHKSKIRWSDEGINEYRAAISNNLGDLRKRWLQEGSSDTSSFSVMLQSTYAFLDNCARRTNYYIDLSNPPSQKSKRKPLNIVKSERYLRTCYKTLKKVSVW